MRGNVRIALLSIAALGLAVTISHPGVADTRPKNDPLKDRLVAASKDCARCCCGIKKDRCTRSCKEMPMSVPALTKAAIACEHRFPKDSERRKDTCGPLVNASIAVNNLCARACAQKAVMDANQLQVIDE